MTRKCRFCRCEIPKRVNKPKTPEERVQNRRFCSIAHLLEHQKAKRLEQIKKAQAKEHHKKLVKVRQGTKQDKALESAQTQFNRYIRLRDAGKPCISCKEPLPNDISRFDAGHFRTRASCPELRFDERNVYGQCRPCNGGSRNASTRLKRTETIAQQYEANLRHIKGNELVDWVKGPHQLNRYRRDDLLYLAKVYRRLCKWIESST